MFMNLDKSQDVPLQAMAVFWYVATYQNCSKKDIEQYCGMSKASASRLTDYISRYHVAFNNIAPFQISTGFNMQKYEPGQAYYAYHCERAGVHHSNRILVWMVYLNDVYDCGETEFFYYHHYEPARKGTMLLWPTDWTHLHRGITTSETKYILTGWYTFIPKEEREDAER